MGELVIQYLEQAHKDMTENKKKKLNLGRRGASSSSTSARSTQSETEDENYLSLFHTAREVANAKVCASFYIPNDLVSTNPRWNKAEKKSRRSISGVFGSNR